VIGLCRSACACAQRSNDELALSPVSIQTQSLALRALRKRKPQETQSANHGCHCFDRAFLLAGACVCCVKICQRNRWVLAVFVYATHATQAIAFEWKPGFTHRPSLDAY